MKSNGFNNWSIEKGDYKRDETTTWTFQRKLIRKRRIKKSVLIILYTLSVSIVSYLIFA